MARVKVRVRVNPNPNPNPNWPTPANNVRRWWTLFVANIVRRCSWRALFAVNIGEHLFAADVRSEQMFAGNWRSCLPVRRMFGANPREFADVRRKFFWWTPPRTRANTRVFAAGLHGFVANNCSPPTAPGSGRSPRKFLEN